MLGGRRFRMLTHIRRVALRAIRNGELVRRNERNKGPRHAKLSRNIAVTRTTLYQALDRGVPLSAGLALIGNGLNSSQGFICGGGLDGQEWPHQAQEAQVVPIIANAPMVFGLPIRVAVGDPRNDPHSEAVLNGLNRCSFGAGDTDLARAKSLGVEVDTPLPVKEASQPARELLVCPIVHGSPSDAKEIGIMPIVYNKVATVGVPPLLVKAFVQANLK